LALIFDSCIWVALASGQLDRERLVELAGDVPVFVWAISLGELRLGVESCSDPQQRALRAAFLRQLETRPTLGVSKDTAAAFGVLAAAVKAIGRSPRPRYNDLWLAAQAIEHGYRLLTLNPRDFEGLPGLQLLVAEG
jgi:predicted nucleic acid-binding protein